MKKYNNPLNNIKIASPCAANWDEMFGDEHKRHCSECKLNVYNLSDMTQIEAENFLINSEGRVCVKFYRRTDGTVLTQNCPVGWQRLKKRVSQTANAVFSMFVGIFSGLFTFNQFSPSNVSLSKKTVSESNKSVNHVFIVEVQKRGQFISLNQEFVGKLNLDSVKSEIKKSRKR